ncbi:MAG TPA: hypothetical protein VFT06_01765 [Flavisolibacter sp.]|nr:hypothetical protein [Flavisolibacter sp.]
MKFIFILAAAVSFWGQQRCNREVAASNCYRGRLEIKGICSNYTISVREGQIDSSRIEASWTDENTKKTYTNVFALGSPCNFPDSIAEGQEFYFTLDSTAQDCMVCQAYYPKPARSLSIKVLNQPCR